MATRRRGRGEGSIEVLPSGKFRVVLSCGVGPGGKRQKMTRTFLTKREAAAWRDEQLAARRRGVVAFAGSLTLREWLERFAESKRTTSEGHTHSFHARFVGKLQAAVSPSLLLVRLTALDVQAIYAQLARDGVSNDGIRKAAVVLSAALNAAVSPHGLLPRNPARGLPLPRHTPQEVKPWTADEARRFLGAARSHRLYPLFVLALDSGMRPGELLALHWPEVEWDRSAIRVEWTLEDVRKAEPRLKRPKTRKSRRTIVVATATLNTLRQLREETCETTGRVFQTRRGTWISLASLRYTIRSIARKAGVPYLRPHGFRHTNATLLLQSGVNIRLVSERLGHENITTTLRLYAHILDADQGLAAVAVARLFHHDRPTAVPADGKPPGLPEGEQGPQPEQAAALVSVWPASQATL